VILVEACAFSKPVNPTKAMRSNAACFVIVILILLFRISWSWPCAFCQKQNKRLYLVMREGI